MASRFSAPMMPLQIGHFSSRLRLRSLTDRCGSSSDPTMDWGLLDDSAVYDLLLAAWLVLAAVTFFVLFLVTAPYGKFFRAGWGTFRDGRLGWILQEIVSPLAVIACFLHFLPSVVYHNLFHLSNRALLGLVLWNLHYLHRAVIWPLRRSLSPTTWPVVFSAVGFNLVNGYLNGWSLARWAQTDATASLAELLRNPAVFCGCGVMVCGAFLNVQADEILLQLKQQKERKKTEDRSAQTRYSIPHGGLFEYVSSANYIAEVIEWMGYAMIFEFDWAPLSFLLWTAANLIPRAVTTDRWYRKTFGDRYPSGRKAVIPFVF